ncbi:MAG: glycosyltransferase [Proteobacteria bacterium]|nr:glycosyltransferase [Pseudomonadota bacterium]
MNDDIPTPDSAGEAAPRTAAPRPKRATKPAPAAPAPQRASAEPAPGAKRDAPPELELAFYREFYEDLRPLTDEQVVTHWLREGQSEGRHPSLDAAIRAFAARGQPLPGDFDPALYRLLNPDIAGPDDPPWKPTLHYLRSGSREGRPYRIKDLPAERAQFLSDLYGTPGTLQDAGARYLTLAGMLADNGIHAQDFLRHFDDAWYAFRHRAESLRNRTQCIRHFAETGVARIAPISPRYRFDPAFYGSITPAAAGLAPAAAYRHWLNEGAKRGEAPNASVMLAQLGLSDTGGFPAAFDADLYLAANPDLRSACSSRWLALRHLIEFGLAERRPGAPPVGRAPDLYCAAADRLARADDLPAARGLYEQVLLERRADLRALQHGGDCLFRMQEWFGAAELYRRRLKVGQENVWTFLNLSNCYQNLGRWRDAVEVLADARRNHPEDANIVRRYWDLAAEGFDTLSGLGSWYADRRFYAVGRAHVADAADLLSAALRSAPLTPHLARARIRTVGIVADMFLPQCVFYRVDQKREQLQAAGFAVRLFDQAQDLDTFAAALVDLDAVIFYRVPAVVPVVKAIEAVRTAGLPSFYEVDDLLFDPDHFPDSFESYGGQIPHDMYAGLVTGTELFAAAMRLCDYAIASTTPLLEAMEKHVVARRGFVHRNALSAAHRRLLDTKPEAREPGPVRIFYGTGTKAHNQDFTDIAAPALVRLFEKHGRDVHLVVVGYLTMPPALNGFADRITMLEPIWDVDRYWQFLSGMDINIAVLSPSVLADCKSEIKWMEAAAAAVPSVVSATATYREVVENGVTGMIAGGPDEWFAALDALVSDAALRRRIGDAARAAVQARYAVPEMAKGIAGIMDAVTAPAAKGPARLRLLVVNVFFPPQAYGGATRIVADNVRDLQRLYADRIEVEVFTTIEGGLEPYQLSVHDWMGAKVVGITTPLNPDIDRVVVDGRMERAFAEHLDRFKPDLIHFHCIQRLSASVCGAARARGIPYLVTVHDGWWISERQFLVDSCGDLDLYDFDNPAAEVGAHGWDRLKRMRELQTNLAGAARILSVSEQFAAIYRGRGFANVVTIENGVTDMPVTPRKPSPDGKVRVGFFGGVSVHKGFYLVRSVFEETDFPNLSLTVIDDRIDAGAAHEDRWGTTRVLVKGKVAQHQMPTLYAEIDVLLAPSVWPESYGLVAREARQAGCWVVASDRGGVGGDVTPESGFVIDVSTPDGLRDALREIDRNPARYRAPIPAQGAPRRVEEQARELAALYFRLAGPPA